MNKVDWRALITEMEAGVPIAQLSRKYNIGRTSIYRYLDKLAFSVEARNYLTPEQVARFDARKNEQINIYDQLLLIQRIIESTSTQLQKLDAHITGLFRNIEDMKLELSSLHEEHLTKSITDLRNQLRNPNGHE